MEYLAWPAPGNRCLARGPRQLQVPCWTKRTQRAPFHAPPQVGKEVDTLHWVAHVDEGVKATRGACDGGGGGDWCLNGGGDGDVRGATTSGVRHVVVRGLAGASFGQGEFLFLKKNRRQPYRIDDFSME